MERNVMGELNVYRGSGAKPNFSEIARRHGMDRHTVAKYWREGQAAAHVLIGHEGEADRLAHGVELDRDHAATSS